MFSTVFGVSVAIGRSILERRQSPRRSVDKYDDDDDDDDEEEEEEAMSSLRLREFQFGEHIVEQHQFLPRFDLRYHEAVDVIERR